MEIEGRGASSGVELVNESDLSGHPCCPHGPTLLFEKYSTNGKKNGRRFYACSANRDRKHCKFFMYEDDFQRKQRRNAAFVIEEPKPTFTRKELADRLEKLENVEFAKFCRNCSQLLLPAEINSHTKHGFVENVSKEGLTRPSRLLLPKEENKTNAQYFFSDRTVSFLSKSLLELKFQKVLCIGTPRIHEYLCTSFVGLSSLLLDIDDRFAQFYNERSFCQYNLFNHHFYNEPECEKTLSKFLTGNGKTVIILDPPFGGLIDGIANCFEKIISIAKNAAQDEPNIILVFPYFNETRIIERMLALKMLDYKVDYENHKSFNSKNSKQKGSAVRLFTDIDQSKFVLPSEEGYKFCKLCERYVAAENRHCNKCKACTSKDGQPYRHCKVCKTCVKLSRTHCTTCNHCVLPNHICGEVKSVGTCHNCGETGHKRRECPSEKGRKRQKT